LVLLLGPVGVTAAGAQQADPRSATWLRTVRDTPLWSGSTDPAEQFTTLPLGSFLQPRDGAQNRLLVFYPGDGVARQPGVAWVDGLDVGPSGPPPWVAASELDGDEPRAPAPGSLAPKRSTPRIPPRVSAPQIAVVDEATGLLLYGQDAHTRQAPASTTKIATALVTLAQVPPEALDDPVRITVDGWQMALADGSSIMGLVPGQLLSMRTLLFGLLLPSGNDAAEQLARTVGPSRGEFVAAMNALAVDELGLQDTHFVNPSGLDAAQHYTSAFDLAMLGRRAMADATFRDIVATPDYRVAGLVLSGHNPLLGVYPGADGIKTGTTAAAGRAIVGSAVNDGHRVLVVVLHSEDPLADSRALFDWVWASFSWP
jgi:D-alanyl-D-alanine carboxypeptidase